MKERKIIWIEESDHRIAKSVSSMKGITMEEYVGQKIREDIPLVEQQFRNVSDKKRRKTFDFPF